MFDWELVKELQVFNDNIKLIFKKVSLLGHYVSHPRDVAVAVWNFAIQWSFHICLSMCFIGVLLYLAGVGRGAKVARIAFFTYLTINIFNWVM